MGERLTRNEAKRATVLEHYRTLYLLLVSRENTMWTAIEREAIQAEVDVVLERLWRTGDIFLAKPDVAAELANEVYYLRRVFPDVLPLLDRRLRQAWVAVGRGRAPRVGSSVRSPARRCRVTCA